MEEAMDIELDYARRGPYICRNLGILHSKFYTFITTMFN
jgi:hypothetical protein